SWSRCRPRRTQRGGGVYSDQVLPPSPTPPPPPASSPYPPVRRTLLASGAASPGLTPSPRPSAMLLASLCAPAFRWSRVLVVLALLSVSARAQRFQASTTPGEVHAPDTHVHVADGTLQPGIPCGVPTPTEAQLAADDAAVAARNI